MIKRTRPTAPRELLDPAAEVARERDDAMKYYTASVKSKEGFAFKVYRQRYVKEALEKIFFKKCAYCESLYVVTTPVDIEHFRPKSAVKVGRQKKLGYYWLASEWTNLLPSCNKCNRPISYPTAGNKRETMGKTNFFPLEDEAQRATKPGEEVNEKPMLLNPLDDEPSEHLEFDVNGIVRAALDKDGNPSKRGEISIRICALSRPELIDKRAQHASSVLIQIERVKNAAAYVKTYPKDNRFEADLRRELAILKGFLEPEKEYAALAKTIAEGFLNTIKAELASA